MADRGFDTEHSNSAESIKLLKKLEGSLYARL